jgi:AcrR family transcriptional regulator
MTKVGDARRASVLDQAMHLASIEGLEGLTLGRLAETTRLGKSAIQTLFGTKQDLQLAIVAAASAVWERDVLHPADQQPDGLPRLRALMEGWIDYLQAFEGGCLFVAAAGELDGRPGPVRDAIERSVTKGYELLRHQAELALRLGELSPGTDIDQLVFELHAMVLQANHDLQLLERADALDRARIAIDRLLSTAAAPGVTPA